MRSFFMMFLLVTPILCADQPAVAKKPRPATVSATVTTGAPTAAATVSVNQPATSPGPTTATVSVAAPGTVVARHPGAVTGSVQLQGLPAAQVTVQADPGVHVVQVQPVPVRTVTVQAAPFGGMVEVTAGGGYPPPPPQQPVAPSCMATDEGGMQALVSAIQAESFSSSQLRVLGDAAQGRCFLVSQVAEILPLFSFEEDKLKALAMVAAGVLDRQNNFRIYGLFTFENSKEQARRILSR